MPDKEELKSILNSLNLFHGDINLPKDDYQTVGPPLPPVKVPPPASAWSKAATIGASRVGERYQPPSFNEMMSSDQSVRNGPLSMIAEQVAGPRRPETVARQDPYGIEAASMGAGPPPIMAGTTLNVGTREAEQLLAQLAQRNPALAEQLMLSKASQATVAREMRGGLGNLAKTLAKQEPGQAASQYALKPSVQARLTHFFELGAEPAKTANWEGVTKELLDAFGGDVEAARKYSRIWGATSPNTSVPRNTAESISAWLHALQTEGRPLTVEEARAMDPKITMAGSKVPNINRAMTGEPLSGDKVEAMAGFMVGDPRLPVDVHALYGLGSKNTDLGPEFKFLREHMTSREGLPLRNTVKNPGLTDTKLYTRYEQAVKDVLADFDPKRDVNSIFAQTWEGIRAAKGLKPQGGPIDILRKKGLLEAGAMLDKGTLIKALQSKGWTAGAIAGLIATLHQSQTDAQPTAE